MFQKMKGKFELGQVVATPGALETFGIEDLLISLARHSKGDWGDMDKEDKAENDLSLKKGFRLFSAYEIRGKKLWIITEWDRSVTTFLLPEEY
jgi:hypothetical protein